MTEDSLYLQEQTEKGAALLASLAPLTEACGDGAVEEQKKTISDRLDRLPLASLTTDGFGGEQMNELFSPDTSEARLRQLCAECGVEYLLYCPEQPGSETQLACFERVYQNESCTIYRVQPDTET